MIDLDMLWVLVCLFILHYVIKIKAIQKGYNVQDKEAMEEENEISSDEDYVPRKSTEVL